MMGLGDRGTVWRDRGTDEFQKNGKSLREGNTREKQSYEKKHLPDRATAIG